MLIRIISLGVIYLLGYIGGAFLFVFSMAMIGQGSIKTLGVVLLTIVVLIALSSRAFFRRGNNSALTK